MKKFHHKCYRHEDERTKNEERERKKNTEKRIKLNWKKKKKMKAKILRHVIDPLLSSTSLVMAYSSFSSSVRWCEGKEDECGV